MPSPLFNSNDLLACITKFLADTSSSVGKSLTDFGNQFGWPGKALGLFSSSIFLLLFSFLFSGKP